jgi:hypothetical protein
MRTTIVLTASLALLAQTASPDPAAILAASRDALGGEKKLSAVKTIVATGRTQQVRGNNLVPIEFEMNIELPDKYVRKDEIPAQESGPSTAGFNGETLIQTKAPAVKQDFARLMLGMFASSFAGYPLTFTYAGQAEAPHDCSSPRTRVCRSWCRGWRPLRPRAAASRRRSLRRADSISRTTATWTA